MNKISVLMTVFNSELYLKEAIDSILSQTLKDFEFVIVDDCSTDSSQKIIESYKDSRIVYLKNEKNLGQTQSLNFGLTQCHGEYVARMDADDISLPERLQIQFEFLESHPDIAVVGAWCLDINQQGQAIRVYKTPTDSFEIKCNLAASGDLTSWSVNHPTVMMRRSALQEVGFYDAKKGKGQGYPQDYELWSRLSPRYGFANIPKVLVKYRILLNSDSRFYSEKQIKDREEVTKEKIQRFLPNLSLPETSVLQTMLEYQPQKSYLDGKRVYSLFEQYFESYVGKEYIHPASKRYMARMKFYYLPQLFRTNKCLALKEFMRLIIKYQIFLFDIKFYRKLGKVFLGSILSKEKYHLFVKKFLLFR